jgi:ERCC4-type nuclease
MSKSKHKYTIIRDTREQANHGWFLDKPDIVIKKLNTGDYSLVKYESEICIERKATTNEIAINFIDDRFERELQRMRLYEHRIIICEFDMSDVMNYPNHNSGIPERMWKNIKMSPNFLLKKILEFQKKYEVPFVFAGHYGEEVAKSFLKRTIECLESK